MAAIVVVLLAVYILLYGIGGWSGLGLSSILLQEPYGDTILQYGNQRVQFDMYCQAVPVASTYKDGSSIMLDNRSGDARIISLNKVQYRLAGHGWALVKLSAKNPPETWSIDCGSAVNVGKITIQK